MVKHAPTIVSYGADLRTMELLLQAARIGSDPRVLEHLDCAFDLGLVRGEQVKAGSVADLNADGGDELFARLDGAR